MNLFRRLRPFPPGPAGRPAPARPRLEALEARCVPATFTVSNLGDSGGGSLRQAVADAETNPGADTVVFQAGLSGQITLSTGEIDISESLSIQGPGANVITVSG